MRCFGRCSNSTFLIKVPPAVLPASPLSSGLLCGHRENLQEKALVQILELSRIRSGLRCRLGGIQLRSQGGLPNLGIVAVLPASALSLALIDPGFNLFLPALEVRFEPFEACPAWPSPVPGLELLLQG